MSNLNVKTRGGLEFITEAQLTDQQMDVLIAVSTALNGVRMDMRLQDILDAVTEMFNAGHPFDSIGLTILAATVSTEDVH